MCLERMDLIRQSLLSARRRRHGGAVDLRASTPSDAADPPPVGSRAARERIALTGVAGRASNARPMSPRFFAVLAVLALTPACRRTGTSAADSATDASSAVVASDRAPVTATPPSADALVVIPGAGIGPFSLGMSRSAVRSLASEVREVNPQMLEVDHIALNFNGVEPAGTVATIQIPLAQISAGVRIGSQVLASTATYAEIVSVIGPCTAPQAILGATITPCQGGGVKVLQVGPTHDLLIEVSPAAP